MKNWEHSSRRTSTRKKRAQMHVGDGDRSESVVRYHLEFAFERCLRDGGGPHAKLSSSIISA